MSKTFEKMIKKSDWHFNWFSMKRDPYYARILCRLIGNWDSDINIKKIWKEDKAAGSKTMNQIHESGVEYKDLYDQGNFDFGYNSQYVPLVNAMGLKNTRILIHNQKPGQMHPLHMDQVYGGGHWDYLGDEKENKVARCMIMLDDWYPGQAILMGNDHFYKWQKGDVIYFRWQDVPHGTCNFGHNDRPMLFLTGEITSHFQNLLDQDDITEIEV